MNFKGKMDITLAKHQENIDATTPRRNNKLKQNTIIYSNSSKDQEDVSNDNSGKRIKVHVLI